MELASIWEIITYIAAAVSIIGPTIVCIIAAKWIIKTYFSKNEDS